VILFTLPVHRPARLCTDNVRCSWISCSTNSTKHLTHRQPATIQNSRNPSSVSVIPPWRLFWRDVKNKKSRLRDRQSGVRMQSRATNFSKTPSPPGLLFFGWGGGEAVYPGEEQRDVQQSPTSNAAIPRYGFMACIKKTFRHKLKVNFHYAGRCPNDPDYVTSHDPPRAHGLMTKTRVK
jgi:hypothetical protein